MAHQVTNINYRGRLTQIIVLLIMILCGVLFSQIVEARNRPPFEKPKYKIDRPKYRISVHKNGGRTCHILNKKRHAKQNNGLFASNKSKRNNRSKAMAETDGNTSN